jgi:hypothetical protein
VGKKTPRPKRPATAHQLTLLARHVLREALGTEDESELAARVKEKLIDWDLTFAFGRQITSALASARYLEKAR